jgi:hypothetical protein
MIPQALQPPARTAKIICQTIVYWDVSKIIGLHSHLGPSGNINRDLMQYIADNDIRKHQTFEGALEHRRDQPARPGVHTHLDKAIYYA